MENLSFHCKNSRKMVSSFTTILFITAFAGAIAKQVQQPCPDNVTTQLNFNMTQYAGKWFIIERFDSNETDMCTMVQYCSGDLPCGISHKLYDDESSVLVIVEGYVNSGIYLDFFFANWTYNNTIAELSGDFFYDNQTAQYQILETDYQTYGVVFICEGVENSTSSNQEVQIIGRQQSLTPEILNQSHAVLEKYAIDQTLLVQVNQIDCTVP